MVNFETILDELTSGLDPISEANLLDKLLAYRPGKTTMELLNWCSRNLYSNKYQEL